MLSSKLPEPFKTRMKQELREEFPAFIGSYDAPHLNGLRVNTLKISSDAFRKRWAFDLQPIAWADEGFYYHYTTQPGQHPYHDAGVYYLQEPSAMAVLAYLDPQPGERILDLAAAPGGKSTGISARLNRQGLLWSNEIQPQRAKILAQNLDRWGAPNVIVSNETPHQLAASLPRFFDKVLLDAPCSGEGMFRKDPDVINEWSLEHVQACAHRQSLILESAAELVRPGGRLVYSTCTFAPDENESVILRFLESHPDFCPLTLPDPADSFVHPSALPQAVRLYPHHLSGEGHFIVALKHQGQCTDHPPLLSIEPALNSPTLRPRRPNIGRSEKIRQSPFNHRSGASSSSFHKLNASEWEVFRQETITSSSRSGINAQSFTSNAVIAFGDHLYAAAEPSLDFRGLTILRPGLYLGEKKPGRFQPGQALALALSPDSVSSYLALSPQDPRLERYLRGEAFPDEGPNGWVLIGVDEFPLGWGKRVQGLLKNHYPKAWRKH